jgi:hypothetical protein
MKVRFDMAKFFRKGGPARFVHKSKGGMKIFFEVFTFVVVISSICSLLYGNWYHLAGCLGWAILVYGLVGIPYWIYCRIKNKKS